MTIECLVLGAGQEVGKSCVVVSIGGKKIMFDCGMHMGYLDHRRYPDFSLISETGDFDSALDCIIITHFHLDHVGALPYFTEVCGYHGPIYMTYPTKALAPLMLEDFRKVMVERRGEQEQFSYDHIMECMKKVTAVDLKQTVHVNEDLQIRAYYAGHVIGAAMFYAKVGDSSMVYTGDYNMTPDRHLGAAQIDRLQLDLLITESTYATTIRDTKYAREREFIKVVHKCVAGGGKVLIPTFALGRAQELCILLEDYWERMNLKVPIYFSAGLTIQANMYYKMLIGWTSQKIKDTCVTRNAFDFKHVCPFDRSLINAPGPCVLFATPGMLSGGFSLEVFKQWAPSEINLVTLPGYCIAGTVGRQLMSGKATKVDLDKDTRVDVRCQIHQLSFSPHTDAKGIMDLVGYLSPRHVILVHGEKPKMSLLKERIQSELGITCYHPANNETALIPTTRSVKVDASKMFLRNCSRTKYRLNSGPCSDSKDIENSQMTEITNGRLCEGILLMEKQKKAKVMHEDELLQSMGLEEHKVRFHYCCPVQTSSLECSVSQDSTVGLFSSTGKSPNLKEDFDSSLAKGRWLQLLLRKLKHRTNFEVIQDASDHLHLGSSFQIHVCLKEDCSYRARKEADSNESTIFFCCNWSVIDEKLARRVFSVMRGAGSGEDQDVGLVTAADFTEMGSLIRCPNLSLELEKKKFENFSEIITESPQQDIDRGPQG